ncbi:MAG: biotin--[acetyl-CoA-carboxylase] ligase [Anaerolineae bacterium]|nr:biotin--[acetyl-CoA-carboxylase] ligase [Anaerolineae bacterium]
MIKDLTRERIQAGLKTHLVGRYLEAYTEIPSTNSRAVELARSGAQDGAVVVADTQSAGRGRLGRRWFAPPGTSLLISLVLRPELEPGQAPRVTMLCSLAALEAIRQVSGVESQIKWPNDLVVGDRKLGGVLTELGLSGTSVDYVVVGMGINVNLEVESLPEVMTPPTSLLAETGRPLSRLALLQALLEGVEARYLRLQSGWSPHAEWRQHLATLGQSVQIGTPEEIITGQAVDVDADGALLVLTPEGARRRVLVGDVTLRGQRLDGATSP